MRLANDLSAWSKLSSIIRGRALSAASALGLRLGAKITPRYYPRQAMRVRRNRRSRPSCVSIRKRRPARLLGERDEGLPRRRRGQHRRREIEPRALIAGLCRAAQVEPLGIDPGQPPALAL